MKGPIKNIRSGAIEGLEFLAPIHEWEEGRGSLHVDLVSYKGKKGAIFTYTNPPVHQMGNPGLEAYLEAFRKIESGEISGADELSFLILNGAADPVHAGGDLKESLRKLEETQEKARELKAKGAPEEAIDALYNWGDARLDKGFALYESLRRAGEGLRTVAICSGGTRFGGSAEVPLMADYLVGDSRSAMCFSESQIGLIPGWGGVGRAVTKAGFKNSQAMAMTCPIVKADELLKIGIYDQVVDMETPLPRKARTDNREKDKADYIEALAKNDETTAKIILPAALELAVAVPPPPKKRPGSESLKSPEEVEAEVARRSDPTRYEALWGKPIKEVKSEIKELGKPLAPQSIQKLQGLFEGFDEDQYDEKAFIKRESEADARLYRDPRFMEGILATLKGRVANFTEVD